MSRTAKIRTSIVALSCTALLVSACSGGGADDEVEAAAPSQEELDELLTAVAAAENIRPQLQDATDRLVRLCVEDAGFDIHPAEFPWEPEEVKPEISSIAGDPYEIHGGYIHTVDHAKEYGFAPDPELSDKPDFNENPEFEQQGQEYLNGYYSALLGKEYYEHTVAAKTSTEEDPGPSPQMGGCQAEVAEVIYGTLENAVQPQDQDPEAEFSPGVVALIPPKVVTESVWVDTYAASEARIAAFGEWSLCVEDAGYPYFEITADSDSMEMTPLSYYLELFTYKPDMADEENKDRYAGVTPPPGAPFDEETAQEKKRELAITVAECAEEVGLIEILRTEWQTAAIASFVEAEAELFTWHEDMIAALENAQEALSA